MTFEFKATLYLYSVAGFWYRSLSHPRHVNDVMQLQKLRSVNNLGTKSVQLCSLPVAAYAEGLYVTSTPVEIFSRRVSGFELSVIHRDK